MTKKATAIICPRCKGSGIVTVTDSANWGLGGIIFTAGLLNFFDALTKQKRQEECKKCDGNGQILI